MANLAVATIACCLIVIAFGQNDDSAYLGKPTVEWEEELDMAINAFAPGNAVEASPDGSYLYMTTYTGVLLVRDVGQGQPGAVYQYKPPDRILNGETRCNSGIAFHTSTDGANDFLIYAVRDEPPAIGSTELEEISSRIVAISHPYRPGDAHRWISPPVSGIVSGSPVISSDGNFVFFTHNVGNFGLFSVIHIRNNEVAVAFSGNTNATAPGAYAPVNIAHSPEQGNYRKGGGNTNDMIAWGKMQFEKAEFDIAWTYGFQLPTDVPTDQPTDASLWSIRTLFTPSWSVTTRPVLSRSGMNLYFGISKSQARGWRGDAGRRFGQGPSWRQDDLLRDESNKWVKTYPSYGGIALSPDENLLFMPSTTTSASAMSSLNGAILWQSNIGSISRTEPRVSPDGAVVYFQGGDGSIVSKNAETGATNWVYKNNLIEGNAEFSLSPDGTILYFAGNSAFPNRFAYALRVMAAPTVAPTKRPTGRPTSPRTADPTVSPTTLPPTRSPTESTRAPIRPGDPTLAPTNEPTPWWTYEPTQEPPSSAMGRYRGHWKLLLIAAFWISLHWIS